MAPQGRRVRVPTILQMENVECGAASLGMVLAHFGRWVPVAELRDACGVSRDGSNAADLLRAARTYGLDAVGLRTEPDNLREQAMPVILFWEFNHYVVLEKIDDRQAWLNDPATGPRVVTRGEFDEAFTGVALSLKPGAAFVRGGRPPRLLKPALVRLAGARSTLIYALVAAVLALLPALAVPAASKIFVDDVLVRRLEGWVMPLLVGLVLAAALRGALSWLQEHAMARLQLEVSAPLGAGFFHRLLRLPPIFFARRYAGDLAARVDVAERTAGDLGALLVSVSASAISAAFYFVLMVLYDPVLAAIGCTVACVNIAAVAGGARLRRDAVRRTLRESAHLTAASLGGIRAIETLKACGLESEFLARWTGLQAQLLNARQDQEVRLLRLDVIPGLLASLGTAAILAVGSLRAMDGEITLGTLVAFQSILGSFFGPVHGLVGAAGSAQQLRAGLERIEDVLSHPEDPRLASPAATAADRAPVRLSGEVELRGVTFGYAPNKPPLVEALDLHLAPGARVALVGASGSGKSTVAGLVVGLNQPWSGEVLLDGRPAQAWPRHVVAASLGHVDQHVVLFRGSVRDNLTLWDTTMPDEAVAEAAADAGIDRVLARRQGGYDGAIAEGGTDLSGGEAQRIEIARALLHRPSVLVLDEATSALDPIVEAQILDAIRRRGCTTLIVAHRLSTVRDCDEIVVLDRGRVVERGTHESLCAADGAYAALIRAE